MPRKVKLGKTPYIYPIPIVLVGANVHDRPNFATVGDCAIMGIHPPLVVVSLNRNHHTTKGVEEHLAFSINIPSTAQLVLTDYCGIVSGRDADKSEIFEVFYGDLQTVPMISECRLNLECRVIRKVRIQHRRIYFGEVVQTYADEQFVVDGDGKREVVDMTQLDPILYGLDNRYYRVGESIGIGYREGKKYQKIIGT
jgi:flavin reductase (DIM6/NTAB) family NADH-FMN oxidoreductase RutF